MRDFQVLKSCSLHSDSCFMRPAQELPSQVTLSDDALKVMTDLSRVSLVVARPNASMETANAKMIRYGVRMLVVLNSSDNVAGLITANDILGEKPMRFIKNMGGTTADIMVSDLMTPQSELEVISLEEVRQAQVGQIVATLKKAGRQHGLVVEQLNGKQTVCGIFSTTQIARQLGVDVKQMLAEVEAIQ